MTLERIAVSVLQLGSSVAATCALSTGDWIHGSLVSSFSDGGSVQVLPFSCTGWLPVLHKCRQLESMCALHQGTVVQSIEALAVCAIVVGYICCIVAASTAAATSGTRAVLALINVCCGVMCVASAGLFVRTANAGCDGGASFCGDVDVTACGFGASLYVMCGAGALHVALSTIHLWLRHRSHRLSYEALRDRLGADEEQEAAERVERDVRHPYGACVNVAAQPLTPIDWQKRCDGALWKQFLEALLQPGDCCSVYAISAACTPVGTDITSSSASIRHLFEQQVMGDGAQRPALRDALTDVATKLVLKPLRGRLVVVLLSGGADFNSTSSEDRTLACVARMCACAASRMFMVDVSTLGTDTASPFLTRIATANANALCIKAPRRAMGPTVAALAVSVASGAPTLDVAGATRLGAPAVLTTAKFLRKKADPIEVVLLLDVSFCMTIR